MSAITIIFFRMRFKIVQEKRQPMPNQLNLSSPVT
jgi:hypothetical protein